jgi:hypothetical protein
VDFTINLDTAGASANAKTAAVDLRAYRSELVLTSDELGKLARARTKAATESYQSFAKTDQGKELRAFQLQQAQISKGLAKAPNTKGRGDYLKDTNADVNRRYMEDTKKAEDAAKESAKKRAKSNEDAAARARGAWSTALGFAGAAAGVAGVASLAGMAIGYKGMARLQALSYRASLDLRGLFRGVDASPLLRAVTKLESNLKTNTVTGAALSGLLTRGFNGFFSLLEKAEPYVTAFGQGMLLAGLYAENGILRARLALAPYMGAILGVVSSTTLLKTAAVGGGLAIAVAAGYAAAAAAPFLALAGAVGAVAAALEQASKLAKEWDESSSSQIWAKFKQDIGVTSSEDAEKAILAKAQANAAKNAPRPGPAAGPALAAAGAAPGPALAAGASTGKALAAGVVVGMQAGTPDVKAAGAALAAAADAGVKEKAEIHSPSRLFKRRAGQMGEGAEEGFAAAAPGVQEAAARALVPGGPSGGGGAPVGGSSAGGGLSVLVTIGQVVFPNVRGGRPEDIRGAFEGAAPWLADLIMHQIAGARGVPTGATG